MRRSLSFELRGSLVGRKYDLQIRNGWEGNITTDCLDMKLNSLMGNGIAINGRIIKPFKNKPSAVCSRMDVPLEIPYVVPFSDELSQIPEITGGKGSSLGKLTQLSKDFKNFIVPNGVVVTTSAYDAFMTESILRQVKKLEEILYGKTDGDIKEACQRVMDEIIMTTIPEEVNEEILQGLLKIYGANVQVQKFAIRSSATGEDTEQMSAAGQMETFLGVVNLSEILLSVRKCWASQFSYIAVHYKRQNGQIINSPMAVVIQEMVPCDVAGVLFTWDPLTGNSTLMSITANYGLGESVVAGSEEPDTVELQRDFNDNVTVKNKVIGAKLRRINMDDSKGTSIEDISEEARQTCCLSDDMILWLGNLAVKIEHSYRSHRDIEWGFWNNNLYIFQPGEILVTYSTDIGWTPYFPALAGVVTEIGGLISHGDVVSREYGLPCIAGIQGVTRKFKTGDYVLLNGNKGVLQKLRQPSNQPS